jgi:hypothetical protein
MAEGVLGLECLSPWELCERKLEGGGLSPGDTEEYLEKSLGRVSLYIGLRFWRTWRRDRPPGTSRVEKALETGVSPYRGSVWGTWRGACLPGTLRVG